MMAAGGSTPGVIVRLDTVDSTQSVAFALAERGAADRTVVVADQQLAGWLHTRLGTECVLLHGVRVGRRTRRPIASVNVYRRAGWHGLPTGHAIGG